MAEDALVGAVRRPHNRYLELAGSIHNDEVASQLGFRGGTVAGSVHAAPSTMVNLLYGHILTPVKEKMGPRVGLFGAIEIRFRHGPVFLDQGYDVSGEIVALSQTPKTEVLWFDSWAEAGGRRVARMRMMLRSMKAASPQLYPELASARA